jgi:hypothetical protein
VRLHIAERGDAVGTPEELEEVLGE